MPSSPVSDNMRRLLASVQKLERSLRSAGLPRFCARLPVCWLCWHYCRMLDRKITRIERIAGKFAQWLPTIRAYSQPGPAQMEVLDSEQGMRNDIEATKQTMWELRGYCLDIGRMFEQLGYQSAGLRRRQTLFLHLLEQCCVAASTLQQALAEHDQAALALRGLQQSA